MPIFPWSKRIYRLKARDSSGNWETLQEFDEYVKFSDISDQLKDYMDSGYNYFYLEECKAGGKDCKKRWSYKPRVKPEAQLSSDLVKKLEEYNKLREAIEKVLGIKEPTPGDLVATFVYYRTLLEEALKTLGLPTEKINEILGAKPSGGSSGELKDLVELLNTLRSLSGGITQFPYPIIQPQQNLIPNQLTPQIQTKPPPIPQTMPKEIEDKVNQIVEKALKKSEEALMPPCMKEPEKCVEGEK